MVAVVLVVLIWKSCGAVCGLALPQDGAEGELVLADTLLDDEEGVGILTVKSVALSALPP